jgi:hypothetical protein
LRNFKNREVKFYLSFFLFQKKKKKNRHFAAKTVSGVQFKMVQTLTIINCKNENAHHPQEGFFLTYSGKRHLEKSTNPEN